MLSDVLVVTGLALIFLLLAWLWGRATSAGKPLDTFKRRFLFYGFVFVLGTGYIMTFVGDLKWPRLSLFPAIACWGVVLVLVAWVRYRKQKRNSGVVQGSVGCWRNIAARVLIVILVAGLVAGVTGVVEHGWQHPGDTIGAAFWLLLAILFVSAIRHKSPGRPQVWSYCPTSRNGR